MLTRCQDLIRISVGTEHIDDIIAVNIRLRDMLNKRQKSYAVVEQIGDIFLNIVPEFSPFVQYGAHQLYGKWEFEKEKSMNSQFAQFVEVRGHHGMESGPIDAMWRPAV